LYFVIITDISARNMMSLNFKDLEIASKFSESKSDPYTKYE